MVDATSPRIHWTAIIVAACTVLSAYFVFTQTPLYKGAQPSLVYAFQRTNKGPDEAGFYDGHLQVKIWNLSENPVKEVHAAIKTLGSQIPPQCDARAAIDKESNGVTVVKIELIPAGGTVTVFAWTHRKSEDLDPFAYLQNVLTRLPNAEADGLPDLFPHCWAAAQRASAEKTA